MPDLSQIRTICVFIVIFLSSFSDGSFESLITSDETEVFHEEGDSVTLSCSYSSAISLHWYRQYPKSAPEYILSILQTSGRVQSPENLDSRFSVRLNGKKNRVDLIISSAKVSDSALYYCALEPTGTGNTKTQYKNLPKQSRKDIDP